MTDIVSFLNARLDEDEAAAKAATPGPWRSQPMGSEGSTVYNDGTTLRTTRRPARTPEFADGDHIARHDPARVLADVEAKRRIVDVHDGDIYCVRRVGGTHLIEDIAELWGGEPCLTLKLLALPYADHPDYDGSWRP